MQVIPGLSKSLIFNKVNYLLFICKPKFYYNIYKQNKTIFVRQITLHFGTYIFFDEFAY